MKFEIKQVEKIKTINKCIRFPINIEDRINMEAIKNNVTFSKFVIEACLFALNNMDKN